MEAKKTKIWNTVATYSDFEEADKERKKLSQTHKHIKVKRGGRNGSVYRVKIWNPSEIKKESLNNSNSKLKTKKGKNNKRRLKKSKEVK